VFIVGGAAMALAYDATRVTRDVDARLCRTESCSRKPGESPTNSGLPRWWLNEQASVYISGKYDPGKRRVFAASPAQTTAA
jgi:hypothetical protein